MYKLFYLIVTVALAFPTLAAQNQQKVAQKKSLSDIIHACKRLERNPQIKEFSSEVICRGHLTYWREVVAQPIAMDTQFLVKSEIVMKGNRYRVDDFVEVFPGKNDIAQCHQYNELVAPYQPVVVKLNSCAQLVQLASEGRAAFCSRNLEGAKLLMKKEKTTGRVFNTCR